MMQFSAGDSRVIGGTTYVRDETGNWHAQDGAPASPASGFVPLTPPDPIGMRHKQLENTSLESNIAQTPVQIRNTEANTARTSIQTNIDRATAPDAIRKAKADADKAEADARQAKTPAAFNSESALQARGFFGRAQFSNQLFGSGVLPRDWGSQALADTLPQGFVKSWTSDPRKNAELAAKEFVAATLRRESGAAIGPQEYQSQYERYFPAPGDGPEQIKIKALLRQQAVKALADQAGIDFKAPELPQQGNQIVSPAPGQSSAPPQDPNGGLNVDVSADNMPWETPEAYHARSMRGDPPPPKPAGWKGYVPPTYISDVRSAELDHQSPMQRIDAYMRGVADIPTFGMADKIAAAGNTIFNGGTMAGNLARENAISDYDAKHYPGSRLTGQFAGGVLLPMGEMSTLGQVGGKSALVGAGYGAGSSRHWGDVPGNAATGAVAGGVTGAGLFGVGRGASALSRWMGAKPETIPPLVDNVTGRLNEPLESARPAQRMALAKQFGMDLPLGAAGDKSAAIIEKGLDRLPASAGVMNDTRRALTGQLDTALSGVSGQYGTGRNVHDLGAAAQKGANNWIDRFDAVSSKVYDAIPIRAADAAQTGNTGAALQRLTTIFQSNPELEQAFRNSKLHTYLGAIAGKIENVDTGILDASGKPIIRQQQKGGGLSWEDLKNFRSRIGYEIGEQRFSDSPTKDELRALYGALSEDMRATAQAKGPAALRAFERANTLYKQGQDRIDNSLVALLGDDSKNNPERAAAKLMGIVTSKTTGNLDMLSGIRASNVKGGTWGDVASSLINLMGQPRNSEGRAFNPQTFVQNYADMSEPARNLIFADRGRAPLRKALDQFVMVNQRLAGTDALRNTSNTVPGLIGAGAVMSVASNLAHAATHPVEAASAAAALTGAATANYGLAKLWTNANFVRWATGYTRAEASRNVNATRAQFGRLRVLASQNPAIRNEVEQFARSLMQHANDNVSRAAASGGNQQDYSQ
jgi:hypothetical protein